MGSTGQPQGHFRVLRWGNLGRDLNYAKIWEVLSMREQPMSRPQSRNQLCTIVRKVSKGQRGKR